MASSEKLHAPKSVSETNADQVLNSDTAWATDQARDRLQYNDEDVQMLQEDPQSPTSNGVLSQRLSAAPAYATSSESALPTIATTRRASRAARALQQLGAACRRLSEVSAMPSLSTVTSAMSWVMPSGARRRLSTGWPLDLEAAPGSLTGSDGSTSTPPQRAGGSATPVTSSPFRTPDQGGSPSCDRTPRQTHHPSGLRACSASAAQPDYAPASCSSSHAQSGGQAENGCAHSAPSRRRASVVECGGGGGGPAPDRRLLPPPPPLPPPPLLKGRALAAAVAAASPDSPQRAQAGVFKPRPTPGDGLLYLAPCARSAMWSPERGARWSLQQYELERELYRGYASTVYKAACVTSGQTVVLKVYSLAVLTDFLRHQVLRELDIHSRLRHPGVVQLLAAFREGEFLALVLEYVRGGCLEGARRRLGCGGRLGEQRAAHLVVLPLLRALSYLHRQGVVHRDIKPVRDRAAGVGRARHGGKVGGRRCPLLSEDNLLFTPDWRLKLCDFGVALCLEEERAVTRAGSSHYMAPEVYACPLKHGPADNKVDDRLAYGAAADVFSLGAVVYELLVGFPPFPTGPPPRAKAAECAASTAAPAAAAAASPSGDAATAAETARDGVVTAGLSGCGAAGAPISSAEALSPCSTVPSEDGAGAVVSPDAVASTATTANAATFPDSERQAAAGRGSGAARPHAASSAGTAAGPTLAFPASVSAAARDFIAACLEPHPGDRPTVEQLLQHAWLQGAQQGCGASRGQPAKEQAAMDVRLADNSRHQPT